MNKCIKVQARPKNHILCTMGDGRIIDFHVADIDTFDTEMIRPLRKPNFFKKVFLMFGTPTWPNGYDICPDYIAQHGVVVGRVDLAKSAVL